jgi:predicted permease
MNRLQKKAWTELILCFVTIVMITIPCLLFMAARNTQGLDYVIICLIVGTPTGLICYLSETKKLKKFDEREQAILRKAFSVSAVVFIFYLLAFSLTSFFAIGGKQSIPVVLMPIMVLTGVILAQCTQSFFILIQCAKEDDDETEGGAV